MDDGRIKCTSHWKCVTCMSHTPIHFTIHNKKPIATKVFRYLKTKICFKRKVQTEIIRMGFRGDRGWMAYYLQLSIEVQLQMFGAIRPCQDLQQCIKLSNAYILFSWSVIQASKEIRFLWSLKGWEGCFRSLVDVVFEELLTMNKTCEMEPVLIRVVFPNGFSCLQKVLNLWFIKVGVTLVNKLIQEFATIPNAHHCFIQL